MDLSDGGDLNLIREKLLDAASSLTFGSVPIYQAYGYGVEKYKNPLNMTEDDFLNAFEKHAKDGVDYTTYSLGNNLGTGKKNNECQKICRCCFQRWHNNSCLDVKSMEKKIHTMSILIIFAK